MATISASSKAETTRATVQSAQITNQFGFNSNTTDRSQTAQTIRESSQMAALTSLRVDSQIRTLKVSNSVTLTVESSSSLSTLIQSNPYFLIALVCSLLLLTCCLCYSYRRSRQTRTSLFSNATGTNSFSKSQSSGQTTGSLYAGTTSISTSMSNSSSIKRSDFSQNQTMSITLASKELGILLSFSTLQALNFIN
jgi:hypothetical protein